MAATQKQVDKFVDTYISEYLSRDIEWLDIVENEATDDFSEDQLDEAYGSIMSKLGSIRKQLYGR